MPVLVLVDLTHVDDHSGCRRHGAAANVSTSISGTSMARHSSVDAAASVHPNAQAEMSRCAMGEPYRLSRSRGWSTSRRAARIARSGTSTPGSADRSSRGATGHRDQRADRGSDGQGYPRRAMTSGTDPSASIAGPPRLRPARVESAVQCGHRRPIEVRVVAGGDDHGRRAEASRLARCGDQAEQWAAARLLVTDDAQAQAGQPVDLTHAERVGRAARPGAHAPPAAPGDAVDHEERLVGAHARARTAGEDGARDEGQTTPP